MKQEKEEGREKRLRDVVDEIKGTENREENGKLNFLESLLFLSLSLRLLSLSLSHSSHSPYSLSPSLPLFSLLSFLSLSLVPVQEALFGNGWDRHLFALRKMAEDRGTSLPIFQDKVIDISVCLYKR